jgi:hypothetical protein
MLRGGVPVGKTARVTLPPTVDPDDDDTADQDITVDPDVTIDPDATVDPVRPRRRGDEQGGSRGRGVAAGVLGVLAIVVLTVTAIAVWAGTTLFDSEKVADIAGDALAQPEVQAALATYLTDQVFSAVDVQSVLDDALPTNLQRLEPVLAAGARSAVDRGLTRVLANPDVQDVLTTVVERSHRRAMKLLEGDGLMDGIDVTDGVVTLNTLPLIGRGLDQLQQLGLFTDLQVPDLSADGDPAEQIAALSAATGRDLKDDFGQLVVYRSDDLANAQASLQTAQQLFALAKRAVWLLIALTIGLVAATMLVAQRRWRATLLLGIGVVVAMMVTRLATRRVLAEAPDLASQPGGRAAIGAMLGDASTGLFRLAGVLTILAIVAVVVALFRRQWRRADLVLVGSVVVGVAVVAVIGISLLSLLLGILAGVATVFGLRAVLSARAAPALA